MVDPHTDVHRVCLTNLPLSQMHSRLAEEITSLVEARAIPLSVTNSLTDRGIEGLIGMAVFGWYAQVINRLLFIIW